MAMRGSQLIASLHSAFHEVASRRIDTRFGLLSDDPEGILKRRDAERIQNADYRR